MRAKRTENTDCVAKLRGGTEDNDLWYYRMEAEDPKINLQGEVICSVWVPTHEERERIANGENVRLIIWYDKIPPIAMDVTDEKVMGPNVDQG